MKWTLTILIIFTYSRLWAQDLNDYNLLAETKSISGVHQHYQEKHNDLGVFNSFARIHRFHQEVLVKKVVVEGSPNIELFQKIVTDNHKTKQVKKGYWFSGGDYLPALEKQLWVDLDYPYQVVFVNDVLIHVTPLFSSVKDSAVYCDVFNPNPIASSNQLYGAPYFDNNDLSNVQLQAELIRKQVMSLYENGTFNIRSSKINMVDVSLLVNPIPVSAQDQFVFNRSQPEF